MKKTIFLLAIAGIVFVHGTASHAAPAPWGLAINQATKECAGFWAGDEFVGYKLPEGWKSYLPIYDSAVQSSWGTVHTDVGDCSFQMQKEEACCMELGYTFVSDNIGKNQKTILRDRQEFEKKLQEQRDKLEQQRNGSRYFRYIVVATFGLLFVVGIILIIWRKRKINK